MLQSTLEAAVEDRLIPQNPARWCRLPPDQPRSMRFLAPEEIGLLLDAIVPPFGPAVLLGAYAGLRLGQVLGLEGRHVRLKDSTVTVEQSLTEVRGVVSLGPTKTKRSRRIVALPEFVALAMHEQLEATERELIFRSPSGQPIRRTNLAARIYGLPAWGWRRSR